MELVSTHTGFEAGVLAIVSRQEQLKPGDLAWPDALETS
jgi:hypothetical protein